MNIIKVTDYQEMSKTAAALVAEEMMNKKISVLGLATGGTPFGTYQQLIELVKAGEISFATTHTVNLDEYVGLANDHPDSYHQYMYENFFKHIDIPVEQTHLPNGDADNLQQECLRYESILEELGGVDLQLLGIGENGHIGFNEPGTSFDSKTHIVDLEDSTRKANARFFDKGEPVPAQAVTMGIQTIMNSKKIVLLASGIKKAEAIARLLQGEVSEACPATVLKRHPHLTLIADEAALSLAMAGKADKGNI
ncbi:glucosamine-6-phosphate deaminase [Evansella caseinilytica]|uniref:Glucosamine-6-phosphate deaminase n=1 Tax=Evansella caseinilytica TaxID=1503961 RepID=A0A1H3QF25_9BACI|nr:glucosamine-6-phosphate deaminase [Evansella caseinilytica]SDZ11910.1 glucosamine-6-phosphate deaminase [Evansella caseinilytica]